MWVPVWGPSPQDAHQSGNEPNTFGKTAQSVKLNPQSPPFSSTWCHGGASSHADSVPMLFVKPADVAIVL